MAQKVKKTAKIILIFLLLINSINAADINELLNKSQAAIQKDDYATAISLLKEAIKIDKKSYEINFLLGLSLFKIRKYSEASKYLREAFDIKKNYESGFLLATCLQKNKEYNEAAKVYIKTIEIQETKEALFSLAEVYRNLGDKEKALKTYERLVQKEPSLLQPYIEICYIYVDMQKYNEAASWIERAKKIAPVDESVKKMAVFVNTSVNLAKAEEKFKNQEYKAALEFYNQVLKEDSSNFQALIRKANILFIAKNYSEALEILKFAENLHKDRAEIFKLFGIIYNKTGAYQSAIEYLKKARVITPNDYELFYQLGYSYEHIMKDDLAIAEYNNSIKHNKDFGKPYIGLARIYIKSKDYQKAEDMLKEALKKGEKGLEDMIKKVSGYKFVKIADRAFDEKKYSDAIENYKKAVELIKSSEIYISIANCALAINNPNMAIEALNSAKSIDVNNYIIYEMEAKIYKERNDEENYRKSLKRLEELKGKNPEIWISIGYANEKSGDFEGAEKAYRKALAIDKTNSTALLYLSNLLYNIAVLNFNSGNLEKSQEYANSCLKILPNYYDAKELLEKIDTQRKIARINIFITEAEKYYHDGKYKEAIETYERILELKPDMVSVQSKLAYIFYITGNNEKALKLVENIETDPLGLEVKASIYRDNGDLEAAKNFALLSLKIEKTASIYNLLGTIYFKQGNPTEAIENFKAALKLDKNNVESYVNLGNLYFEKGAYDLAEIEYKKALELAFDNPVVLHNLGIISFKKDRLKESADYFKKALNFEKNYYGIYFGLGRTEYYLGNYEIALKNISKAMELKKDIMFNWALGLIYAKLSFRNEKYKKEAIENLKLCVTNKENDEISVRARKTLVNLLPEKKLVYENRYPFKTEFKPIIAGERLFYYSTIFNRFVCSHFEAENIMWQNFTVARPAIQYIFSDKIYYFDINNIFYCIDPYSGNIRGQQKVDIIKFFEATEGVFALGKNKKLAYLKEKKLWEIGIDYLNEAEISVSDYGDKIIVSTGTKISIIDKNLGVIKATITKEILKDAKEIITASVEGSYVYAFFKTTKDDYILCCIEHGNKIIWENKYKSALLYKPILNSGMIINLFKDGTIVALNMDGKLVWQNLTGDFLKSYSIQKKRLILATEKEKIVVIDIVNGKTVFETKLGLKDKQKDYFIIYVASK